MTRPENQMRLARFIPTGLTNIEANRRVDPKLKRDTPSDPANMTNALELDADFWVEYGAQLTQRFNAWVPRLGADDEAMGFFPSDRAISGLPNLPLHRHQFGKSSFW